MLEGEDHAAFDELYDRVWEAVKPADILEEIFIFDVICSEWEILRWRRFRLGLMRAHAVTVLVSFLNEELDYEVYAEAFADDLAQILQSYSPEGQEDSAQTLAHECARNQKEAVDKVNKILTADGGRLDYVLDRAKRRRAEDLAQDYFRGDPDAATLVQGLLTAAGKSMDTVMAHALVGKLDSVERINRLATIAESHRNASLRELDRRRTVFGETLRRSVQQIEHDELEVIETTPAKGKKVA